MMLELQSRLCGEVHVVECKGRIVAGPEIESLERALAQDTRRDISRVVLHVGEVSRMDSSGLGLLVRWAINLRRRGGDLRLAAPPPFLTSLLHLTRVANIMESFATEDEAILSFLQQQSEPEPKKSPGGRVLVIDPSGDFCAFVRAVLGQHGFDVNSASLVRDARILLQVGQVAHVLIGPNTPQITAGSVAATLRAMAPRSRILELAPEFKTCEAHACAESLLQMLKPAHRPSNETEMRQ